MTGQVPDSGMHRFLSENRSECGAVRRDCNCVGASLLRNVETDKVDVLYLDHRYVVLGPKPLDASVDSRRLGCALLSEFLTYVDQNLGLRLTLSMVSRRVNLSRATFTKTFRSFFGIPFHQYLMLQRVEAARRLLQETEFKLHAIAEVTGFSSQAHFSSVFRRLSDCSPGQFRTQSRAFHSRSWRCE